MFKTGKLLCFLMIMILACSPIKCYAEPVIEYQIEPQFELMGYGSFYEGMAIFQQDRKSGYIDTNGQLVVPQIYQYAYHFSEGLAVVGKTDIQWGFIDKEGNEVIPCDYTWASGFSEGLAPVQMNDKWGYVDKTGELSIPIIYDWVGGFSDGLAPVVENMNEINTSSFIDKTGNAVIKNLTMSPEIRNKSLSDSDILGWIPLNSFYEELAAVHVYFLAPGTQTFGKPNVVSRLCFIDKSGEIVILTGYNPTIHDIRFSEGLAYVRNDYGVGYINKKGEEVIPCQYIYAWGFSEGLARAQKGDKWGYIDKDGNEVIPFIYDSAEEFQEGLACVRLGDKNGFIDKKGNVVIPFEFDNAMGFSEGLAWVTVDGLHGVIKKPSNGLVE